MSKIYEVLIIDDHPLISEAYRSALEHLSSKNEFLVFNILIARDSKSAYNILNEALSKKDIDIVFLDIRLPEYRKLGILSGEDLGIKIREWFPKARIIISTTFNTNFRIHSIFKSINPEGFLVKDETTPDELKTAITNVIDNIPYYSNSVTTMLRKQVSNNFLLDKIDRLLLYELSMGAKMKDLPNIIPLSIAGIEKRKRHLKQIFEIETQNDRDLIEKAKELGFI